MTRKEAILDAAEQLSSYSKIEVASQKLIKDSLARYYKHSTDSNFLSLCNVLFDECAERMQDEYGTRFHIYLLQAIVEYKKAYYSKGGDR